jgi:glutamate--cysteine ligase
VPHARRSLTQRSARVVCESSFTGSGDDLVGIEAEWPVHRGDDVGARPTTAVMRELGTLVTPHGSRVTFEPGGQVEVSTAPAASIDKALVALTEDAAHTHAALAAAGWLCSDRAVDGRRPQRVLEKARYQAMEAYFAAGGTSGAWMMNNTASTQVNLSHDPADADRRWFTLNQVAPILVAAFANSPGTDEQGRQWASLRQAMWWATDRGRTRPVRLDVAPGTAWLHYALDADVAFVCTDGSGGGAGVGLRPGFPFARWMQEGHELGWPTEDDLRYHLSMLFPPVRPRGWLELRVLDALPSWIRTVACLVVAITGTAGAAAELRTDLPASSGLWAAATRDGIRDPRLGRAADALFAVVNRRLAAVTRDGDHEALVEEFTDRFVRRRRMPGDEYAQPVDLRTAARPTPTADAVPRIAAPASARLRRGARYRETRTGRGTA